MAFDNTYTGLPSADAGSNVGNREQLLDLTTVLAPRQAPVYGMLPKQAATADLVEWTVDGLRDAVDDNAVAEGVDVDSSTGFDGQFTKLARLGNRLQHFRETFAVTKKQEIMDSVTPVRIQEAEEKAASQVLRDIEKSICSDNVAVTGNGSTANEFRGLGAWINNSPSADGVQAVPSDFVTPSASIIGDESGDDALALTEARFNNMLTSIFQETGEQGDHVLVAGTSVRNEIVDGFTRVQPTATQFNQGDGSEVNYNVEIFQGPYGIVKIISGNPKCLDHKRAYLLDPSLLGFAEAMSMGSTMLEDQGGGPRGYIDTMGTLICKGPNGLGKITDFAIA